MNHRITLCGVFGLLLLLAGCAGLGRQFEAPEVQLVQFRPLPSEGFEQRFAMKLRVLNPNDKALELDGLYYTVKLQGHKVVSGVSSQLPTIPAYGEGTVELEAATSLIGGFRVLSEWLSDPGRPVAYELETRLSTGWWGLPVTVTEKGEIAAPGARP